MHKLNSLKLRRSLSAVLIIVLLFILTLSQGSDIPIAAQDNSTTSTILTPTVTYTAKAGLNDLRWNSDGSKFAMALTDGTVEIVNAADLSETSIVPANYQVLQLDWNPVNPNELAITAYWDFPHILNLSESGTAFTILRELTANQNFVGHLRWSPDGQMIATIGETGGGNTSISAIKVWDANTGALLATYQDDYTSYVDMNWHPQQHGVLAVTGVQDHYGAQILVWDVIQDQELWHIYEPQLGVLSIDWDNSGQSLVTGTDYRFEGALLTIWDSATGDRITDIPVEGEMIGNVDWSPNADIALIRRFTLEVRDGTTYELKQSIANVDSRIAWSINGDLAYRQTDGTVRIFRGLGN